MTTHRADPRRDLDAMDAPTVTLGLQVSASVPGPTRSAPPRPAPAPAMPPRYGPPAPVRSNGWAVAVLVLGIVCLVLSPVPILNQAGILVGLVGVGLAVPALLVGVRHRVRLVMASIGAGLSVLGLVVSFAMTAAFVSALDEASGALEAPPTGLSADGAGYLPVEGGGYLPVGPATPSGPITYELELTSPDATSTTAPTWTNDTGGLEQETTGSLPFRRTVTVDPANPSTYATIGGSTPVQGKGRTIACTIKRDGVVVAQDRQTGTYASVSCHAP